MQYFDKVVYTFSADNEPTGSIDSGEIVIFRTQDCFSNQMHSESQLVTSCDYSKMNPATGPLFVRDARPGDVIRVELLDVQCDTIGTTTTLPKIGPLWDMCETRTKRIPIENGKAVFNDVTFPINPMIGVIGVAPEKGKSVPCGYPGRHGGNLDCKLMVKGNTAYFPVRVEGGLVQMGDMHAASDVIDFDSAALIAEEFHAKVEHEVHVSIEERLFTQEEDSADQLVERPPVVVVMGHVDHGKTSILDRIRSTNVTAGEAGGITQAIGAYQVNVNGSPVTFLDTPGHEAFTAMRARGADMTDIAVLVVAADDGIMPQTIESINHAKAANVKIIVAMNKMDKPTANPERVMEGLTKYGIITEDWGGDVACIPVSALTGMGINDLLERIALEAEVMELKANPNRRAKGAVVEARLDKGQGPIATILVQNGTLHSGDVIIAGTAVGRVRTMRSDKGQLLSDAGPSTPVEITGLTAVPEAGDLFEAVEDERLARELAEQRVAAAKEKQFSSFQKVTLDNLFSQMAQNDMKELAIVVKADVQGSAEAVKQSLEKISNDEVRVRVIHAGVGAISKSDVDLADASNAIIIGFNVRPDNVAKEEAAATKVEMRMYRVIYDAINDVTDAMKGMLAPKFREVALGELQVRQVYKISNVGTVAGCRVTSGKITRDSKVRVVRDGIVITEDEIASLKRFKDDAKEVAEGYECGVTLAKFADVKEGDVYEAFKMEEYRD